MHKKRIPEIDFLRTLALLLMILYHLIYDLDQWTALSVDVNSPHWFLIGKVSAILFIFLSGVSLGLSKRPVRNGLQVLFWGLVISLVTWIFLPNEYVRFGILHFLGLMMITYPLFKRLNTIALLSTSVLTIGLGLFFNSQIVNTIWLMPLGLKYPGFSTIDYYPLLPYSGVTLIGILIHRYYLESHRKFFINPLPSAIRLLFALPIFQSISRHSLMIYLLHQPLLLLVIIIMVKLSSFS